MKRKITVIAAAASSLAIALIAAACGSSSSGSYSSSPYGAVVQASAPNGFAGAVKVGVANSPLGRIVVDSKGRTLYLFEMDNRRSLCYAQCAQSWPPLLTHGKPVARAGVKQLLLGMTRRANGSQQVTYAGHPLYRFAEDRKPGQSKGEGSQAFGAGWDVLSPAGKKIESGTEPPAVHCPSPMTTRRPQRANA
jgi:predicted lipoprotein with Yx(FWY)xxD motif